MIKTIKKVIILAVMIVFGISLVFAQESNTSKATYEEIGTDVDNFLSSTGWKSVELDNIFAFTRFGANIRGGAVDMGFAVKPSFYLGAYYKGSLLAYSDGTSRTGKINVGPKDETINFKERRKGNPNATYGVLLGMNDLGIKVTLEDKLSTVDMDFTALAAAHPFFGLTPNRFEYWKGSITPAIQIGLGGEGALKRIGLSMPIVYNRLETLEAATGSGTAAFNTYTIQHDKDDFGDLLTAKGNYVQPDIYIRLGFGALTIDNTLGFRIFGVPAVKSNGKATTQLGVANVESSIDNNPGEKGDYTAIWDNRFWLQDELVPMYNFSGTSENKKLDYSATIGLPITIGIVGHSMNLKSENKVVPDKTVELKAFNKGSEFNLGLSPWVNAGVKYQILEMLSLQGGIGVNIFDWQMNASSTKKVEPPTTPTADEADMIAHVNSEGYYHSVNSSETEFTFDYPKMSFGVGFTLSFKQKAALDFVYIHKAAPSAAGTIYKVVGDGLGSGDTSVVLTINF
jgi:hypothetical protein